MPTTQEQLADVRRKRAERQAAQANKRHLESVVHLIRAGTSAEECTEIASILKQVARSCSRGADFWEAKAKQGGVL